ERALHGVRPRFGSGIRRTSAVRKRSHGAVHRLAPSRSSSRILSHRPPRPQLSTNGPTPGAMTPCVVATGASLVIGNPSVADLRESIEPGLPRYHFLRAPSNRSRFLLALGSIAHAACSFSRRQARRANRPRMAVAPSTRLVGSGVVCGGGSTG